MADKKFYIDLDLNLNQILKGRAENVATDPAVTAEQAGRLIFNTTERLLKYCNGTAWVALPSSLVLRKGTTENGETEYTFSYGGVDLTQTIVIPKDKVVQSGSLVNGTWAGNTFTPSETGSQKALKLVIANSQDVVYVNVDEFSIDTTNLKVNLTTPTPSGTQATAGEISLQSLSQIVVNNIAYLMNAVPQAIKTSFLTGKSGSITTNFGTNSYILMDAYQVTKDKPFKIVGLDLGLDSSNNIMWNSNQALDDENIIIIAHAIKGREVSA